MTNLDSLPPPKPEAKKLRAHRLVPRDLVLLRMLGEHGCLDPERIKAKLWNGNPTSKAHYRRLGILKRMGLLENVLGDQGFGIGYRVTQKGLKVLTESGNVPRHIPINRGYRTQLEHDQIMFEIRDILESSPIVKEYRTEGDVHHELLGGKKGPIDWQNAPTIPDGTFVYEVPGQRLRIALEIEITFKTRARYFKILRNHLLNKTWDMTFYIMRDQAMLHRLLALIEEVQAKDAAVRVARKINGIYLCSLDEIKTQKLKAQFTNGKRTISLDELAQQATRA